MQRPGTRFLVARKTLATLLGLSSLPWPCVTGVLGFAIPGASKGCRSVAIVCESLLPSLNALARGLQLAPMTTRASTKERRVAWRAWSLWKRALVRALCTPSTAYPMQSVPPRMLSFGFPRLLVTTRLCSGGQGR